MSKIIKKLLVANRGEIAIRILRAANELQLKTVAIYAEEDKFSLHRFKADEAYQVGRGLKPIDAYLSIESIIDVAVKIGADAIHPGYGFLSENPDFADACKAANIIFVGPTSDVMRALGDKVSARELAVKSGIAVVPASDELPEDFETIHKIAKQVGYPLMLKASWGGGGRGMRVIMSEDELEQQVESGKRESKSAFGRDEVYLEKLVERARHVEVQIIADSHGNVVHLFERDCSVQRRHQKIVERAPAPYLNAEQQKRVCDEALKLMRHVGYQNAGTVEFLMDVDTDDFYFIEVNPRLQVEHTVTEEVTGIDIVKAQILISQGAKIGDLKACGVPNQEDIKLHGCAIQCRITSEDPSAGFVPDYGRITTYRSAMGFGIRLDGGPAYSGAVITRHYDSLLEKVTAWAPSEAEAIARMDRALREFRIRGISTNIPFLENVINHPKFRNNEYTTRFIDNSPELFDFPVRKDRATRLLRYIADVSVNGHPQAKGRPRPIASVKTPIPLMADQPLCADLQQGSKDRLNALGPEGFSKWMVAQKQVLITDTTMRDAHQSLLATRMRTYDILEAANAYAVKFPELLSLECWGGATFDVAMRFLQEDPWARLRKIRVRAPNILLQMLLRGSNAVGYKNYPDNVVKTFITQASDNGVDLFRVFDSLNWVENMRVAIDAVLETGKLCEGAICYTGDILDPNRKKFDLDYYIKMGLELKSAGVHILALKDMAGLVKPKAAEILIKALKKETGLPVHFHTHDSTGIASASVLAAIDAGVDAVDLAMDSFSGLTSQPNLGSVVNAIKGQERDSGLDTQSILEMSNYWRHVRDQYAAFEPNLKSGASEVYLHEMPGGQFTNLQEQARSLGLYAKWPKIAKTYSDVNEMFGDIPKVTPSSKVVGDLALAMVSADLDRSDIENPDKDFPFPASVVSFFKGELGQPPGGFPKALQDKVLRGEKPYTERPGKFLDSADFEGAREELENMFKRVVTDEDVTSYLLYPTVFKAYYAAWIEYGPVSILPTLTFFYGMETGDEINIELEAGKVLSVRFMAVSDVDAEGNVKVFFELNGQPRSIKVPNRSVTPSVKKARKADDANVDHIGAPLPGAVMSIAVSEGQEIAKDDLLLTIEAMKMETSIFAQKDGKVTQLCVDVGDSIDAKDLLMIVEPIT
ncbi:MAG: pyruvate carboxylase [Robiginitomaculum sp.]|nr:MAG: pyruvate carboxylase [Robiginitomaculum sp.]